MGQREVEKRWRPRLSAHDFFTLFSSSSA